MTKRGGEMMQIRIKRTRDYVDIPKYAHSGDAGLDLCAVEKHRVPPLGTVRIPTGIAVAIPEGYQGEVRPRSGLASKGIHVILGTIDSGYRGEVEVVLFNSTGDFYTVRWGDRIAQLVIMPVIQVDLTEAKELDETERGTDGFGSTGMGLDGPKELEETEPVDPFADVTDRYKIFCLAHGQESPTAMDRFVAEVGGPSYLLWLGSHMVAWKQARGFAPDHRMTHADHADFDAWLAEQALGEAGGLGETGVTDSEHIARILDGLSKLGCGNHSCYFNPPQGVGTTGGCDCLNGLPFQLRRALIGLWMDRSGDKRGSETTDRIHYTRIDPQ